MAEAARGPANEPAEREPGSGDASGNTRPEAAAPEPAAPTHSELDPEPRERPPAAFEDTEPVGDEQPPAGGEQSESQGRAAANGGAPVEHYDDLDPDEIVGLLESLEKDDLSALLEYERRHAGRDRVVGAIEGLLARRGAGRES